MCGFMASPIVILMMIGVYLLVRYVGGLLGLQQNNHRNIQQDKTKRNSG